MTRDRATAPGSFSARMVRTSRLDVNVWARGPQDGIPLLLVHGNLTTGGFWRYVAEELPPGARIIAPDMRGFGRSERRPIDATRGLGQMVDDIRGLLETLGLTGRPVHAAGWSMGGGVLLQYLLTYPEDLASITLLAPLSPYGFGGTTDERGTPAYSDFAGTGGGAAAPEFVRRLAEKDRSTDEPATSPLVTFRTFFGPGDNTSNVDEDFLVTEFLATAIGDDFYPGNTTGSTNWPNVAPGDRGVLNAMSPKYYNAPPIVNVVPKPPITWIRGRKDQVVSDRSMMDFAVLGAMGVAPGWPGEAVFPAQPMEAQTRAVLAAYEANGGRVREVVLDGVGHGIPIAAPAAVAREIAAHNAERSTAEPESGPTAEPESGPTAETQPAPARRSARWRGEGR